MRVASMAFGACGRSPKARRCGATEHFTERETPEARNAPPTPSSRPQTTHRRNAVASTA